MGWQKRMVCKGRSAPRTLSSLQEPSLSTPGGYQGAASRGQPRLQQRKEKRSVPSSLRSPDQDASISPKEAFPCRSRSEQRPAQPPTIPDEPSSEGRAVVPPSPTSCQKLPLRLPSLLESTSFQTCPE